MEFYLSLSIATHTNLWRNGFSLLPVFYLQYVFFIANLSLIFLSLQMVNREFNDLA